MPCMQTAPGLNEHIITPLLWQSFASLHVDPYHGSPFCSRTTDKLDMPRHPVVQDKL